MIGKQLCKCDQPRQALLRCLQGQIRTFGDHFADHGLPAVALPKKRIGPWTPLLTPLPGQVLSVIRRHACPASEATACLAEIAFIVSVRERLSTDEDQALYKRGSSTGSAGSKSAARSTGSLRRGRQSCG